MCPACKLGIGVFGLTTLLGCGVAPEVDIHVKGLVGDLPVLNKQSRKAFDLQIENLVGRTLRVDSYQSSCGWSANVPVVLKPGKTIVSLKGPASGVLEERVVLAIRLASGREYRFDRKLKYGEFYSSSVQNILAGELPADKSGRFKVNVVSKMNIGQVTVLPSENLKLVGEYAGKHTINGQKVSTFELEFRPPANDLPGPNSYVALFAFAGRPYEHLPVVVNYEVPNFYPVTPAQIVVPDSGRTVSREFVINNAVPEKIRSVKLPRGSKLVQVAADSVGARVTVEFSPLPPGTFAQFPLVFATGDRRQPFVTLDYIGASR